MLNRTATHASEKDSATVRKPHSASRSSRHHAEQVNFADALARALAASELSASDILALQRTAGNRAVEQILRGLGQGSEGPSFQSNLKTERKECNTALPDNLKAGIEDLSSMAMDDVKVHYNSSKPAQVQAVAYTEGTDIHIAAGQEKHVPH